MEACLKLPPPLVNNPQKGICFQVKTTPLSSNSFLYPSYPYSKTLTTTSTIPTFQKSILGNALGVRSKGVRPRTSFQVSKMLTIRSDARAPNGSKIANAAIEFAAAVSHRGHDFSAVGHKLDDDILDEISRWIFHKTKTACSENRHFFSFIPKSIRDGFEVAENMAVPFLREILILSLCVLLIRNTHLIFACIYQWSLRFRQVEKGEEGEGKVLKKDFEKSLLHIAISPFQFFISSVCFSRLFIFTLAKLKIKILRISSKQLYAVSFVLSLIWFFLKWKEIVFEDLSKKRPNELPQLHMFERVATLCIMSIGFITTAEVCGVKVKALFAIGGISGVAIGLAAKELVSNFFGGLMLYATRPFLVGDNIKTVSFSGEVQDIGFFQTQILGKDKSPMTVPNQFFTNMLITNLSKSKFVVLEATFQLRHQDILLVDRISIKIVEMLKSHPSIDPTGTPMAYLQCMTSSSLEFYMRINLKKMPANEYYRVQQEIIVKAAQIMIQQGAALGSSAPFDPTVPDFQ